MKDVAVRRALAKALDLNGYVKALGGETAAAPAESIVNPGVSGYTPNPAFADDNDNDGDPEAAKALLDEAGVKQPVAIKLAYPTSPTADKAMAVIKEGWDAAGFDVALEPQGDTYYDVISRPD